MSSTASNPFKPPSDLLVVTTPFVSGYHVTRVIGATFGLIVDPGGWDRTSLRISGPGAAGRSRSTRISWNRCATKPCSDSADHARSLGANAVVSVGFDTSEMGGSMTEVLAYGTAVVVEPDTSPAQPVALH